MKRIAIGLVVLCALAAQVPAAHAAFNGVLYITNFVNHNVDSVKVTNSLLVGGSQGTITNLPGADGIVCRNADLFLIVGGQLSNDVIKVQPTTGAHSALNTPAGAVTNGAFLITLNNDESKAYTTGLTNNGLGIVDYATGTTVNQVVTGTTTTTISGIVFLPNGDLYVGDSPNTGTGNVYKVDQTTWVATQVLGPIPSAHGMVYDAYTGHVFIVGGDWIQEFDFAPATPTLVRQWDVSAMVGHPDPQAHLDGDWVDGKGNFFTASNSGPVIYLDLTLATPVAVVAGNGGFGLDDITGCAAAPPPPPPSCDDQALSWGFWKHQCSTNGHHQVSASDMQKLFAAISASNSKVFGAGGCFTAGCDLLNTKFTSNMQGKAAQQYLALLLNKGAKLVTNDCVVTCKEEDGTTVGPISIGDIIADIEANLCKSGQSTSFYSKLNGEAECGNTFAEEGGGSSAGTQFNGSDEDNSYGVIPAFAVTRLGSNPVRLSTGAGVSFRISSASVSVVRVGIYDAMGRLIAQPVRDRAITGTTSVTWDGLTLHGTRAATGTYFYRAVAGSNVVTGRFVVID